MTDTLFAYYAIPVDDETFAQHQIGDELIGDEFVGGLVIDGITDLENDEQALLIVRKEIPWENSAGKKENEASDK